MFAPRSVPLELTEARLHGLRLSLNTPVVSTQELPVGPARAVLLVHDEPNGRPNVTIGVRSLRSGAVVLYSFQRDLRPAGSVEPGVEAALSFAESMGFLFDEDEIASGAPDAKGQALGLFGDLMGHPGVAAVAAGEGTPGAPSEPVAGGSEPSVPAPTLAEDDPFGDPSELDRGGIPQFEGDPGAAELEAAAASQGGYVPQFEGDTGSGGGFLDEELGAATEVGDAPFAAPDEGGVGSFAAGEEPAPGAAPDDLDLGSDFELGEGDFDLEDALAEESPAQAAPLAAAAPDGDEGEDELVLDLGLEAVEIGPEPAVEIGPETAAEAVPLSKFRAPGAAPDGGEPEGPVASASASEPATGPAGRTALGKVKLVRREREDGRSQPAARLFGAF